MTPVFITTCSRNKLRGKHEYQRPADMIAASTDLLAARAKLFARLPDQRQPPGLSLGPDFGNNGNTVGTYQPAHSLYSPGGFMTAFMHEMPRQALHEWLNANQLFFISGLYGLVDACEPIQNYDVRLEGKIAEYWQARQRLLTDDLLKRLSRNSIILDCCGDFGYSALLDWRLIERAGHEVVHATALYREGGQVRAECGRLAATISEIPMAMLTDGEVFPDGVNADICFVDNDKFDQAKKEDSNARQSSLKTPRQRVFNAQEHMPIPLTKYVKSQLSDHYGSEWQANPSVQQAMRKCWKYKYEPRKLNHHRWDLAILYSVMLNCTLWPRVFKRSLGRLEGDLRALRETRHALCHFEDFTDDDATKACGRICRLMEGIEAYEVADRIVQDCRK